MKKFLSVFLSVVTIFSIIIFPGLKTQASTATTCGKNLTWSFDDETGVLEINGSGTMYDFMDYYLPPWNDYDSNIKKIYIGSEVTCIGSHAFDGCSSIISIAIPSGITSIGIGAFRDCSSLTSVEIPGSVTSISVTAFSGCKELKSIVVDSSNTVYDSRGNCNAIIETSTNELISGCQNTVIPTNVTSIGMSAFNGCSNLKSISIPNSITSIGDSSFSNCKSLTDIDISESVVSIGEGAFGSCSSLESIDIPNSVTNIGQNAFYYCTSLKSINISNNLKTIKAFTFGFCSSLKDINWGDNITSIKDDAFLNCNSLESITIPKSVTSIGYQAFYNCSKLTTLEISSGVKNIGESAFGGCNGLTNIVVDNSNTVYDSRDNCNAIIESSTNELVCGCKNTIIPITITSIGDSAFSGCNGLTVIEIPNGVTNIGKEAFYGCTGLTSLEIPDSMEIIGGDAFKDCTNLTLYYSGSICNWNKIHDSNYYMAVCDSYVHPDLESRASTSTAAIKYGDFLCSDCNMEINYQYIGNTMRSISSVNGCIGYLKMPSTMGKTLIKKLGEGLFENCNSLVGIEIPDSVTEISESAFENCSNLVSVKLGNGVTSISKSTFSGCKSLNSIDFSDKLTAIGSYAFNNCSSLLSINIPDTVKTIGDWAFANCSSLTSVKLSDELTSIKDYAFNNCSGLTSVSISNNVTSIGIASFGGCKSLTSINIPDSVKTIDDWAFVGCSGLESIYIPKSVTKIGSAAIGMYYNYDYEKYMPIDDFIIYGYTGSAAETYAINNGIKFVAICNHNIVHHNALKATCTENGNIEYWACSVCGKYFSDAEGKNETTITDITIAANGHTLIPIVAKTAKCTEAGNTEYYICSACGRYFSDAAGMEEIQKDSWIIPALNHSFTNYISNNDATCTQDGTKTAKCDRCDVTNTVTDIGSATGHSFTNYVSNNDATCTKDGTKTAKCDRCDVTDTVTDTGSAKGHSLTKHAAVDATCTTAGNTAYWSCSVCGKFFSDVEGKTEIAENSWIVPAKGHNYGADGVCTVCGAKKAAPSEDVFPDISECSAGIKTAIKWASDQGIVTGLKDGTFAPYAFCTRQQMVIMLWRLSGKPEPESIDSALKFTDTNDLSSGSKKAIAWAVEQGIVSGYKDGSFDPTGNVTRQQTVVMLWRLAGKPEATTTSTFTDTSSCSAGVMKAINWAASVGITKGSSNGDGTYRFAPEDNCQRQHIATFVYRYANLMK